MALQRLGLLAAVAALDCASYGLKEFDRTSIATSIHSTPPSRTNSTVYFNPCGTVRGPPECARDDQFCAMEWAELDGKWQLTEVIPIGSSKANAQERVTYRSDTENRDGEPGAELIVEYDGAKWGEDVKSGTLIFSCGKDAETELDRSDESWVVRVQTPAMCAQKDPDTPSQPSKGGWGFFRWLFVLLILGLVGYAALTVYVNYANAHGGLPTDVGDIVRDIPYLVRDLVRRVSESVSSRRAGYSAI